MSYLYQFSVHVTYGRGSVFLAVLRYMMYFWTGFMDGILFAHLYANDAKKAYTQG